jgi:nitroimidazol reductase NimA-like FMN-containing flavoprotein (pyridoxamine 5'-phosphate oxidase superfamily)
MTHNPPSDRTRVKRLPERGAYDKNTLYSILDEGLVCHVGIAVANQPFVIPMAYARSGDRLIMHGSGGSRLVRALKAGADVCVAVTHLDALVMARSAFHHSMNYRSAVVFGMARLIEGDDAKLAALREFFEHIAPGRWDDVRKPNHKELAQTAMIEIPLDEASAKLRTGPPVDEEEDYELGVWAGLIPFASEPKPPVDDPKLGYEIELPDYLTSYSRKPKS